GGRANQAEERRVVDVEAFALGDKVDVGGAISRLHLDLVAGLKLSKTEEDRRALAPVEMAGHHGVARPAWSGARVVPANDVALSWRLHHPLVVHAERLDRRVY